ncbi:MAG: RHS repeat protein [Bryobacterales bacterium]|nr:RHS repeat protein [Bryobacterales bacterium]
MRNLLASAVCLLALLPALAGSEFIGPDPPKGCPSCGGCSSTCASCPTCGCKCTAAPSRDIASVTSSTISVSEGNLTERVPISRVASTLSLDFVYNSYNADGSRATVDTVMGFGWTHSYNVFLFSQAGVMFRFDGEGRVTKYSLGPDGIFVSSPGYFETLTQSGGVFTITQKDQTKYNFMLIPDTPFMVGGPVYRLVSVVDRNHNTTTLTYSSGNLTSVTDTYNRSLAFGYDAHHNLISVTDPDGRLTTVQYDSTGATLTQIKDPVPASHPIQYAYNAFYQLISKTDKAGRTFTYAYTSGSPGLPIAVQDSAGTSRATLSNPTNWATDPTQLMLFLNRVYIPSTTTNTDGRGNQWQYSYDSNGYLTQTVAPDGATTKYTYDPATLQVADMTDANGNTTTYKYDSEGNRIRMTDPLGNFTEYYYDDVFNQLIRMVDRRGRVTTYTLDPANGNKIKATDPLGQTQTWTYDSHGNVLTHTDKNGHTTSYAYDAFGDVIAITEPIPPPNTTTMTYDAVGNVLTRTDANGHTTSYAYDGMNRVTKVTDATGHFDQTSYDGDGNIIETIDRNGNITQDQYDQRQRLVKVIDATMIHFDAYTYDGNDNRRSFTDRNGHTTQYDYDVQNRLTGITDAVGDVSRTAYDPVGNVTSQTDANGHTTTYKYDSDNRRTSMTDAAGEVTKYFYDGGTFTAPVRGITCNQCGATPGSSLVTEQIDPDGNAGTHAGVTFFKYDALDRLIIKVQKTGCIGDGCTDTINPETDAVTTTVYDPVGNVLNVTEPNCGAAVSSRCDSVNYTYDADNRRIKEVNNAGDTTQWTYDGVGNVIAVTAPNLNVTTNTYDALNRVIKVADSDGPVASYGYDPVGNRTSFTDGNGNTTNYAYDVLNRLITTTDPLGKTTSDFYDPVGNLTQVTDRDSNSTVYAYDAINRRISVTDALTFVTTFRYDPVGNLIKLTDANGNPTEYFYDAVNRPIRETYADGLSRNFTYDPVGNLLTRTDQKAQTTNYSYSDLYFLLSRTYPSAINDSFLYDLSGRMVSATRGALPGFFWQASFAYDGGNRVTQSVQNGRIISYAYNIPGRTRTLTYPGGRIITEQTDARTRIEHIDDAASPPPIVHYTYDAANNVLSRNYRNGTTSSFSYNANNWTLSIAHNNPSTFAGFNYAYDNEGNKQYEQKTQDPGHSECYAYDADYRLTSFKVGTIPTCTVPVTQIGYNLDAVGNLCKTTDTCQFNTTNEQIKLNTCNIVYDGDGNLANDCNLSYTFDEENRLTAATRLSDHVVVGQYQYDALSRRVEKIADASGTPATTEYFYDDARIVEEQNVAEVTQATYVYGNYVDEILTMDRSGQTYYYHQNALWSVEAITNSSAAVVERYSYDAYGLPTTGSTNPWGTAHSAIGNPWLFTGREFDEETGLYFYRARYYDPVKDRFLQRDPLEYGISMNLYSYVTDRPTTLTDPHGEAPHILILGGIAIVCILFCPELLGGPPQLNRGEDAFLEMERLRQENERLRRENRRIPELEKENERLRKELERFRKQGGAGAFGAQPNAPALAISGPLQAGFAEVPVSIQTCGTRCDYSPAGGNLCQVAKEPLIDCCQCFKLGAYSCRMWPNCDVQGNRTSCGRWCAGGIGACNVGKRCSAATGRCE